MGSQTLINGGPEAAASSLLCAAAGPTMGDESSGSPTLPGELEFSFGLTPALSPIATTNKPTKGWGPHGPLLMVAMWRERRKENVKSSSQSRVYPVVGGAHGGGPR